MNDGPRGQNGRGPKSKRRGQTYVFREREDGEALLSLAIGAALVGGAVRIGLTRDNGALAIGIYAGTEYGTEYVGPDEDVLTAAREISLAWEIPMATYDEEAGRWIVS